jgi:hypothetical protein
MFCRIVPTFKINSVPTFGSLYFSPRLLLIPHVLDTMFNLRLNYLLFFLQQHIRLSIVDYIILVVQVGLKDG